jgi:hypothetical protein
MDGGPLDSLQSAIQEYPNLAMVCIFQKMTFAEKAFDFFLDN